MPGHIIADQTGRHSAEEVKRRHVGLGEGSRGHAKHRIDEEMPAHGKDHDKGPHPKQPARLGIQEAPQVSVVELSLLSRRGIVFEHGYLGKSGLGGGLLVHVAQEGTVARPKTVMVTQALMDGGQGVGVQVVTDVGLVKGDLTGGGGTSSRIGKLRDVKAD
ncbi:MAG: hypothetical protein JXA57_08585 [Armatimonadetes bacterium]|nr:hypothetical protein [Armatimonadota bacterium]